MIRVNRGGFGITASLPIAALFVMQAAAQGSTVAPRRGAAKYVSSKERRSDRAPQDILKIGSTVDPIERRPKSLRLAIAPVTAGSITAGDLLISNFNNGSPFNIQGLGHDGRGSPPHARL